MASISYTNKPLIAQEDIVCYKMLVKKKYFIFSIYRTPTTNTIIFPFLLRLFNIPFKARGKEEIRNTFWGSKYVIEKGFIHTQSNINKPKINYSNNIKIFECVIPKGTKYFACMRGIYASKKIKFIKQL